MATHYQPEQSVELYLVLTCRRNGFLCMKFVSPARNGVPDRIVIAPSATVFVEVKRPGEKPTRIQEIQQTKLRRHGGEVHVVDDHASVDALIAHLHDPQNDQRKAAS